MIKNGIGGCFKCDVNQFWKTEDLNCVNCTGSMTNVVQNIRTSCKDTRPSDDQDSAILIVPSTTVSVPVVANNTYNNGSTRNISFHVPKFPKPMENRTIFNVLINKTVSPIETETFRIENTSSNVSVISKITNIENNTTQELKEPTIYTNVTIVVTTPVYDSNTTNDANFIVVLVVAIVLFLVILVLIGSLVARRRSTQWTAVSHKEEVLDENVLPHSGMNGNFPSDSVVRNLIEDQQNIVVEM